MFDLLSNLTKAAVNVAISPVALAVDLVTLPLSAENGDDAFERTSDRLAAAGKNIKKALDD
jgi:hypothetical protein